MRASCRLFPRVCTQPCGPVSCVKSSSPAKTVQLRRGKHSDGLQQPMAAAPAAASAGGTQPDIQHAKQQVRLASEASSGEELPTAAQLGFGITNEAVVFNRWLQLSNRTIRFPAADGLPAKEHEFDIIGHPKADYQFVVVFPFHPAGPGQPQHEVTLLREYSQGVNEMMFVLPSGAFDPRRHADSLEAAQAELSEEAYLKGGEWIDLMPHGSPGPPESKWCRNRMRCFLCVGAAADEAPGEREAEEYIEVHRVTIPQLKRILRGGQIMLPTACTCYFALDELEQRGFL